MASRRTATSTDEIGGQVARDLAPAVALVGAREHLAGARAEVEAGRVERVDRHPLAQHAEVRVLLREAVVEPLPLEPASRVRQTAALPSGMQRAWPGSSGIT